MTVRAVRKVGVVGSGIMGAGIAEVAAATGHEVVVRGRTSASAGAVMASLEKSLLRQVEKGRLTDIDRDATLSRVTVTTALTDLAACDVVVESVVEDLSVKTHLFTELDRVCHEDAILATNTSTLPVVEMAMATGRPDQVCGVHFFNPATVMSLVELVRPLTASEETMASATSFIKACGKEPVEVRDQAGFVVNALLFPMGPFALLDLVGLDTSVAILDALYQEHRDPSYAPVPLLRRMVAAELLGRKSGEGFYNYRS